MSAALLVASTRSHVDARETLRIQDIAAVLIAEGWSVDLLVPRASRLLTVALDPAVRVFQVPHLPFCAHPPHRPSFRRFALGVLAFLRGVALVSRTSYAVVHGLNDGALVARAVDRATVRRFPYVADFTDPFGVDGFRRGLRAFVAFALEHAAMRHAAAVVFADVDVPPRLVRRPPSARVSIIPDPHAEIALDTFTLGEFSEALSKIYAYVTRE